jgi:hypothetical protein
LTPECPLSLLDEFAHLHRRSPALPPDRPPPLIKKQKSRRTVQRRFGGSIYDLYNAARLKNISPCLSQEFQHDSHFCRTMSTQNSSSGNPSGSCLSCSPHQVETSGPNQLPDFKGHFLPVLSDQSWQRRYRLTRVSLRAGVFRFPLEREPPSFGPAADVLFFPGPPPVPLQISRRPAIARLRRSDRPGAGLRYKTACLRS